MTDPELARLRAELERQHAFALRLAEHLCLAAEVLARRAEKDRGRGPKVDRWRQDRRN